MSAAAEEARGHLEPIVRRAGDHLVAALGTLRPGDVDRKGVIDLVTHVDLESQAILSQGLHEAFPGESILAEEGSSRRRPRHGRQWLVDPLDGTTNYVHALPLFAVSVARVQDGVLELGMVYAPTLGELYWGARGAGAWLGDRRLRVSRRADLDSALLATGFPYDIRTNPHTNLNEWSHLATRSRGLRRCGAASIDLAWVAAGRFDGFWEYRLGPWDLAAGALLVQEAGGRLSDPRGGAEFLWSGDVVATNALLHDALLQELRHAHPGHERKRLE